MCLGRCSEKHNISGNLGNKEFINWYFSLIHNYSYGIVIADYYLLNTFLLPHTIIHLFYSDVDDEFLKTAMWL
jgi:hypothetical protein